MADVRRIHRCRCGNSVPLTDDQLADLRCNLLTTKEDEDPTMDDDRFLREHGSEIECTKCEDGDDSGPEDEPMPPEYFTDDYDE